MEFIEEIVITGSQHFSPKRFMPQITIYFYFLEVINLIIKFNEVGVNKNLSKHLFGSSQFCFKQEIETLKYDEFKYCYIKKLSSFHPYCRFTS